MQAEAEQERAAAEAAAAENEAAVKELEQDRAAVQEAQQIAQEAEERQSWVEVVDAVNMRQGPSSANAVIRVQLAGTKLRVESREGQWVEVSEPDSGETDWVFDAYVKSIAPASRRAEAAETTIR